MDIYFNAAALFHFPRESKTAAPMIRNLNHSACANIFFLNLKNPDHPIETGSPERRPAKQKSGDAEASPDLFQFMIPESVERD